MAPDDTRKVIAGKPVGNELYPIEIAFADYDRTRPIIDGRVKPEGLALKANTAWIGDFCRKPVYEEYDAAEMSFSWYLMARDRGEPVVALPIFPLRMPVWAYIYVREGSLLTKPSDLIGKRIGTEAYRYTVNLWLRGLCKEYYGLSPEQSTWVTTVASDSANFVPPDGVTIESTPGVTPEENLKNGNVDAIFCVTVPQPIRAGETWLRRLFPDAQAETQAFFRRTGIMPITHTIVMRKDLADRQPWVAESLFHAFVEAQRLADQVFEIDPKLTSLFDSIYILEQQKAAYGPNPYSHGVAKNRKNIETFVRYAYEQGYLSRRIPIEELFVPSTVAL